jgi:serine phosphatase RsbU (regulator of sigma subunit)
MTGQLPSLPVGCHAERALAPAGGGGFASDFVVSACTRDGRQLEVALVDVSGKGLDAGTRALLLSGALGGLFGAVGTEEFLAAANDYLCRQRWDEGFATAVHVAIDLHTGAYVARSAGHPRDAAICTGRRAFTSPRAASNMASSPK